ncbi:MAG: DJ-1/PfpI family protein [Nitrospira sp.]|nr:DJ-1/PfpI family protein [Nitrospira sp.]
MKTALVIFNNMTFLDFVGFYDPVTRLRSMQVMPDFEWTICALDQTVTDDRGVKIEAASVGKPLGEYDLLFVPGGIGTRSLQKDRAFIEWLRSFPATGLAVSVCTGALLLGATGLLKGKRATTHPSALKDLAPYCQEVVNQRIVDEGNVITAGGVAASIDLGLYVVERLAGPDTRARIATQMDYPYFPNDKTAMRMDPRNLALDSLSRRS